MTNYKKLFKEALTPNYLKEEDRATTVDKMLSGEYEDEDYKDSKRYDDVRAELEDEINKENEKYDHIARAEYGKPFSLLSIAQKQEMLSYMNRETEKEFETDFERRRKGDYSDDMEDGMTDYQRRRIDEELKLGVKYELPTGETGYILTGGSKDPKDWKFSGNKEPYLSVKGKLKPTEKQPGKYDGVDFMDENINDPVLIKTRAAQMKRDAMDSKRISAEKAMDLRYELSILDNEREDILMRIEDIGVEMEQTAEPEGGPIADELGGRLMTAEKELRAIDSQIIDIKDDLGYFDMNESDLDEDEIPSYLTSNKAFEKAVNDSVSFNDFEKRVYGILGPKYFKLAKVENPGALKDFYDSIRGNRPKFMEEELFTPNEIGDEAVEKESNSAAYESLQESLRKKLKKRLS
mgnify:CR=1 FL=1